MINTTAACITLWALRLKLKNSSKHTKTPIATSIATLCLTSECGFVSQEFVQRISRYFGEGLIGRSKEGERSSSQGRGKIGLLNG